MRLYLSSFRMGDHPEHLRALAGDNDRAIVIANALDDAPEPIRRAGVERENTALAALGFEPAELDLRDRFEAPERLRRDLHGAGVIWLRGGNVFVLRYALHRSGADDLIRELLAADALVYAGYSAGPCALSPSLRGLEAVDDPAAVGRAYGAEPLWEGLAVLDEIIVPHYDSPEHPESAATTSVVRRYRAEGVPHRTLRDGQALLVDGTRTAIV